MKVNGSKMLLCLSKKFSLTSDDEINEVLTKVLGDDWENYLYEYKRKDVYKRQVITMALERFLKG